jgi:uncharacterized protein YndB with AHSA1/START domain
MAKNPEAHTVRFHRVLRAPADRIYRAFLEPTAKCRWLPPYGYLAESFHNEIRVGGSYRMSFTNFRTGNANFFGGTYTELIPNQRIRYTDKFEDPSMPGEMQVTVTLRPVACGTEITIVQENIPEQIPVEFCYLGWQESLAQLALLVEPEVP